MGARAWEELGHWEVMDTACCLGPRPHLGTGDPGRLHHLSTCPHMPGIPGALEHLPLGPTDFSVLGLVAGAARRGTAGRLRPPLARRETTAGHGALPASGGMLVSDLT